MLAMSPTEIILSLQVALLVFALAVFWVVLTGLSK